ncbi:MAG: hypothetical protein M9894_19010 [Planctomycetes bacterium]|nr:hypothetical protein [Planctomycetota bacterium]
MTLAWRALLFLALLLASAPSLTAPAAAASVPSSRPTCERVADLDGAGESPLQEASTEEVGGDPALALAADQDPRPAGAGFAPAARPVHERGWRPSAANAPRGPPA